MEWVTATFLPTCGPSPFFLRGPQQVGPQDDGDVAGRHLIHLLLLSQSCQELHQVPGEAEGGLGQGQGKLPTNTTDAPEASEFLSLGFPKRGKGPPQDGLTFFNS